MARESLVGASLQHATKHSQEASWEVGSYCVFALVANIGCGSILAQLPFSVKK
jgi:hypothetical protein